TPAAQAWRQTTMDPLDRDQRHGPRRRVQHDTADGGFKQADIAGWERFPMATQHGLHVGGRFHWPVHQGKAAAAAEGAATAVWADWMFMLGLLGIGLALVLGVGLRIAAVAGVVMVALMWFAVFPPAQHAADGSATGSTNPFVDEHVMDALALIAVAAFGTASR